MMERWFISFGLDTRKNDQVSYSLFKQGNVSWKMCFCDSKNNSNYTVLQV